MGEPYATLYEGSFTQADSSPARELVTGHFDSPGEVTLLETNEIQLLCASVQGTVLLSF